jgi:hypothetical protein
MDENLVKQELQKYNVTDAAIAELKTDYMARTVKDANDLKGYELCKEARIDIKKRRVSVEKTRVQLKAESLEYGRRVDGEAKRITALLEPIETHLIEQEKIVDDEKARIKAEAEEKEAVRFTERTDKLVQGFSATWNGQNYTAYGLQIPAALVKVCTDEQFTQFITQVQEKKDIEDARLKAEEDSRKAEAERLAKAIAEQEAERQRLADISRKQAEESARIKADQEAIEAEKKRIADAEVARLKAIEDENIRVENDKSRLAELEQARKEAAEKAKTEAEVKAKRDAEEKAEKERLAKIAAEKKAARAPDKEKIQKWIDGFNAENNPYPKLSTPEAIAIFQRAFNSIEEILQTAEKEAEAL